MGDIHQFPLSVCTCTRPWHVYLRAPCLAYEPPAAGPSILAETLVCLLVVLASCACSTDSTVIDSAAMDLAAVCLAGLSDGARLAILGPTLRCPPACPSPAVDAFHPPGMSQSRHAIRCKAVDVGIQHGPSGTHLGTRTLCFSLSHSPLMLLFGPFAFAACLGLARPCFSSSWLSYDGPSITDEPPPKLVLSVNPY